MDKSLLYSSQQIPGLSKTFRYDTQYYSTLYLSITLTVNYLRTLYSHV